MSWTSGRVEFFVVHVPEDKTDRLLEIWRTLAAGAGGPLALKRSFPFVTNPPPDMLFTWATGVDLMGSTIELEAGSLHLLRHHSHHARLAAMTSDEAVMTATRLAAYAEKCGVACDEAELVDALENGTWPHRPDAMHQAAAFVHHLVAAMQVALSTDERVVWAFRNVDLTYEYPSE